jgi:hypothetical protein
MANPQTLTAGGLAAHIFTLLLAVPHIRRS